MLLCSICVFLISLIHITIGKLLQVNHWHEVRLQPEERAILDLSLYMSCESLSILFDTNKNVLNRLQFIFDEKDLHKVDVDSPEYFEVPSSPLVIGGCRESNRKFLRITFIPRTSKIEIRLQEHVIVRPKSNNTDIIRILLPQKRPCCLIRGVLSNNDVATSTSTLPLMNDPQIQASPEPTTSVQNYQRISWTDVVNREWSTSFIVCSTCILILMVAMIIFGVCTFIYLQTKPGGKPYTIED